MDNDLMKDGIRNQLNDFIKQTWEVIGNYQNAITSLQTLENQGEIIPIIEDIISDNMIHVGQLQKALELMVPEVIDKISEGEKQAELTLSEEPDEGELEEVEVEVQEPEVEEQLQEAIYTDNIPNYMHIASVGLYSSGNDPEEQAKEDELGHYEIDVDNKVFTRVKGKYYLGNWMIESFPRDTMAEVDATAKNIMSNETYREVSNDEYLQIQKEWEEKNS